MRWDQTCWIEDEDRAIRAWLYETLDDVEYLHIDPKTKVEEIRPWRPNRRKIADVVDALAASIHLSASIDPPVWLDQSPVPAGEVVACTNGLLHVGTRKLQQLTPLYFNRVAVPFDWDPAAPQPSRWLEFLNQLWPDDLDSIAALQQFFGYVLSGRTDLHKILLLIGPTRAGKGVIARVLTALVGKGNVAGPTLASLGTNFGLAPLLGKPLAVVSDARLGGQNVHQVVERLLSISGEDTLTVDRKFRDQWTGKLPSRFIILSNELPRFGDASGAIAHRFLVLILANSWLGKEDPKLTDRLLEELPGILDWSLDGLDQLTEQGRFTEPASSSDALLTLQDLVSPVAAFVRDECITGAGLEVLVFELYAKWKTWCEDSGRDKPGTIQTFGRDLRTVVPRLRTLRPRDGENRERRYVGITLKG
jgi:putative DNA primase/helicase